MLRQSHITVVDQGKEEEFNLQGEHSATKKLDGVNQTK